MDRKAIEARLYGHRLLTEIIVDQIPERFFKSPITTFADLAMGGGQYLSEVLRRCEKYHSREQILPRLFGWERNLVYFNRAMATLKGARLSRGTPFEIDMKFDVIIGNPPYQAPKDPDRRGPGGDNALFLKFIDASSSLLAPGGFMSMVTPPSAFTKTTINGRPTKTLSKLLTLGSLKSLDVDAGDFFNVGTSVSRWTFQAGERQDKVAFTKDGEVRQLDISDIYFCPPNFEWVEFDLFKKIVSNRVGSALRVTRSKPGREVHMKRLGYPKINFNNEGPLGFDSEHAEFMTSQLGLWLLDYIRRHDQFIYHNLLTGIHIPPDGFTLTDEEASFIASKHWPNNSVND